ncbi:SAV_915 family protein [Rhodococcoides navarretei]|uniref:SAV_915 family protein n=1 Tax=Rhodococcus navarretei TaxID=3128981 RepID=A0ABU9CX41_9NOCA
MGEKMRLPDNIPPVVYVPCTAHVSIVEQAVVDLRTTRDGRSALLAYSALDRLHTCCGDDQPWMVLPTTALSKIYESHPFDLLLMDVMIPQHERRSVHQ